MTVNYKVGNKVRILDASKIERGLECFNTGDITKVLSIDEGLDGLHLERTKANSITKEIYIYKSELKFIELVNDAQEFSKLLSKIESLEKRVVELESKSDENKTFNISTHFNIKDKLDSKLLASKIIETLNKYNKEEKLSNNELRKKIIEDAKWLVDKHINEQDFITMNVNKPYNMIVCSIMDKVTGKVSTGKYEIPKDKCYNEHIGKAVALSKALGIDYSKFENAVKPDEVVEGMVVNSVAFNSYFYDIVEIKDDRVSLKSYTNNQTYRDFIPYNMLEGNYTIIEDTNAKY